MALVTKPKWQPLRGEKIIVDQTVTGTTSKTALYTWQLPAYQPGPNGMIGITSMWSNSNSANVKTPSIEFGGTAILTGSLTTLVVFRDNREILWNNSLSVQKIYGGIGTGGWHTSSTAVASLAKSGTSPIDIVFYGQLANASDTLTLDWFWIYALFAD